LFAHIFLIICRILELEREIDKLKELLSQCRCGKGALSAAITGDMVDAEIQTARQWFDVKTWFTQSKSKCGLHSCKPKSGRIDVIVESHSEAVPKEKEKLQQEQKIIKSFELEEKKEPIIPVKRKELPEPIIQGKRKELPPLPIKKG
jgi:hypothetical protein